LLLFRKETPIEIRAEISPDFGFHRLSDNGFSNVPRCGPGATTGHNSKGTVTREGTTEPLPDVQIAVVARGSLAATGFSAQQVLQAVNRGAAVNPELVQMARDASSGGPRAALANAAPITAVSDTAGRFTVRNVPVGEHHVRAQLQNYFGPAINGTRPPGASEIAVVTAQQTAEVPYP
jgi:hypothetical protein